MRDATTSDGTVAVGVESLYELTTVIIMWVWVNTALYYHNQEGQNVAAGFNVKGQYC